MSNIPPAPTACAAAEVKKGERPREEDMEQARSMATEEQKDVQVECLGYLEKERYHILV
jgi:hypothetical protein